MKARVTVTLKSGILDPQGKAIEGALKSLGIAGVDSVRQGKIFDIEISDGDRAAAQIVAVGEAARNDHEVGAGRQRGLGVPHHGRRGS